MENTDFNIDALITEWQAIYIDQGQTAQNIKTQIFAQDDIMQDFTKIPEKNTVYRSAYATIGEVLQAFTVPFTDKALATFQPHEQRLGEFKIDKSLTPDRLRDQALNFCQF